MYYVPEGTKTCGYYECKKCGNRLICVYVCSKKYLKKWQIHLVIIILIMMKTLQNIWKHKREFQINIFMVIGIDKFQFGELNTDTQGQG